MAALITKGYGTRLVITRGLGVSWTLGGGMRHGGRAYISTYVQAGGGFRFGGTSVSPGTFLAALVSLMRSSLPLLTEIGGARIYSTWPGQKPTFPFVLIEDYVEQQPGEVIEHEPITLTIACYADTATKARLVGRAVQECVDTPAMNKRSTRGPLFWVDGSELDSWREPTLPPVRVGKTAYGAELFRWSVTYTFNILPRYQG